MNHVSVPLLFPEKLVWPWPAEGYMLRLPPDLLTTTTLANPAPTLVTNYTSAMYVINACPYCNVDRPFF